MWDWHWSLIERSRSSEVLFQQDACYKIGGDASFPLPVKKAHFCKEFISFLWLAGEPSILGNSMFIGKVWWLVAFATAMTRVFHLCESESLWVPFVLVIWLAGTDLVSAFAIVLVLFLPLFLSLVPVCRIATMIENGVMRICQQTIFRR